MRASIRSRLETPLGRHVAQLMRFGLVGGLATIVHALVYAGLTTWALAAPQVANLAGFLLAFSISLLGHYGYTFRDTRGNRSLAASSWRLFLASLIGYALNAGFVHLVTAVAGADPRFALIFIVGVTPLLTYLVSRFWVFR